MSPTQQLFITITKTIKWQGFNNNNISTMPFIMIQLIRIKVNNA